MTTWVPDGEGVQPGGDIGGDAQATGSFCVRYLADTLSDALVTVYFYGSFADMHAAEPAGPYPVTIQTEAMVCSDRSDPGSTEIWSSCTYTTAAVPPLADRAAAEQAARDLAGRHTGNDIDWDGRPPY